MTTDLYSNILMADGQQVDTAFLNNGPRFLRASLMDQILANRIGAVSNAATRPEFGGDDGVNTSTLWAYCLSPGGAFLRQGSANNKIQIAPGTLFQKIANDDGQDATLVPFTFDGTSAGEFTLTNGDATSPRVDLLQMALSYTTDTLASVDFQDAITRVNTTVANTATRRRVLCTLSVKAGTPAASPTIPDPDAGCVPVGTVVVGHGWTTGGNAPIFGVDTAEANNLVVHDQRMPMVVRANLIDPVLYKLDGGWALSTVNLGITSSNASNKAYARMTGYIGRLIQVEIWSDNTFGAGVVTLGSMVKGPQSLSGNYVVGNNFTGAFVSSQLFRAIRTDLEGAHAPAAGPIIIASTTNKIGVPLWTSGRRVPGPSVATWLTLRVSNHVNGATVGDTVFYVAS